VRILVVGSGGREHALAWKLAQNPTVERLFAAPGNAGIAEVATCVHLSAGDVAGIVDFAETEGIDLTVVGPEAPLVAGLVDELQSRGRAAFGPTRAAARLEGSKAFAKEVMAAAGVPTAGWTPVDDIDAGMAALDRYPVVLKFDGLAAGKGVVIADDELSAHVALHDFLVDQRFGPGKVVVEEHLVGEELSLLALCDGESALVMAPAQDYKRIYDGDEGPNTGGMGSYSPVAGVDEDLVDEIARTVHQPVVDELRHRGTPFHGILYAGLMLTDEGPRVLEFNVRFGDPETQAVLPRLRSDLLDLLQRAATPEGLRGAALEWDDRWAVTVVLASAGYPAAASTGDPIDGLDRVPDEVEVTHAGTARAPDGAIVTAGGRVLNVTGMGDGPGAARDAAYAAADLITFEGRQLRRDVALRAVERIG
jgi:phosphoribosylamine--glycine ligase